MALNTAMSDCLARNFAHLIPLHTHSQRMQLANWPIKRDSVRETSAWAISLVYGTRPCADHC